MRALDFPPCSRGGRNSRPLDRGLLSRESRVAMTIPLRNLGDSQARALDGNHSAASCDDKRPHLVCNGALVSLEIAMPRLRQISKADAHPLAQQIFGTLFGKRDPVTKPGTATGTPGNWWTVFAGAPDVFDHAVAGFQLYRSPQRKLDPKLRELGQTRAGWARASRFVFSQHCKAARGVGLSEEQIAAIPAWQVASCFTPVERAVLAYTDALVYDGGRVADGVFGALKAHLSDEEIFEFTYTVAMYDMHAVITKALRLEFDDVDDRIVEVAAPTNASSDVMRMVDQEKK